MNTRIALLTSVALISAGVIVLAQAQQPPPAPPQAPQSPGMTFFIAGSNPGGKGGDLGGLEGADRHCQQLATNAGAGGKTWRAYLSTQAVGGAQAVNARDRIGNGPWQNFKGEVVAQNVADLHGDNNKLGMQTSLTERGNMVAGVGYTPNAHDILTGSQMDGTAFPAGEDRTCRNWTSSTQGAAMVGHSDRKGLRDDAASRSWNSSHPSRGPDGGCSLNDLRSTGGGGLFYCFAAN
jgi:hypothetical protein